MDNKFDKKFDKNFDENHTNEKNEEESYLDTLNIKEKKAYLIAIDHLGSSFQLKKAIGFIEWQKNKKSN